MRVLGFGTYDAKLHPRVQTLLEGLRDRGAVVREANRPLGLSTKDKVRLLQQPLRLPLLGVRLVGAWAGLSGAALRMRGANRPDAVVVGYMGHFDVLLARVLFRRSILVLDHLVFAAGTARDRGTAEGLRTRLLAWLDAAALRAADIVVLDTDEHAALLPESEAGKGIVIPVGAPREWALARRTTSPGDPLRVIFYGLFTPLQGAPIVAEALRLALAAGAPIRATLVGNGQDADAARAALGGAPADWIDWVEPADMPSLVAEHDVCLGIFGTTPKARNVVPNKVYQGAAVGCAIVTSDTPPQRRLFESAARFVPPGDARALAEVLVDLAHDEVQLDGLRVAARARFDRAFAPRAVVAELDAWLRRATEAA